MRVLTHGLVLGASDSRTPLVASYYKEVRGLVTSSYKEVRGKAKLKTKSWRADLHLQRRRRRTWGVRVLLHARVLRLEITNDALWLTSRSQSWFVLVNVRPVRVMMTPCRASWSWPTGATVSCQLSSFSCKSSEWVFYLVNSESL